MIELQWIRMDVGVMAMMQRELVGIQVTKLKEKN